MNIFITCTAVAVFALEPYTHAAGESRQNQRQYLNNRPSQEYWRYPNERINYNTYPVQAFFAQSSPTPFIQSIENRVNVNGVPVPKRTKNQKPVASGVFASAPVPDSGPAPSVPNASLEVAKNSEGQLGTTFLAVLHEKLGDEKVNLVISPISIWAVLLMLFDAAEGSTAFEIADALKIDPSTRNLYAQLANRVIARSKHGEFSLHNFIARDDTLNITENFSNTLYTLYSIKEFRVNVGNTQKPKSSSPQKATDDINQWISKVTHQRIPQLLKGTEFIPNFKMIIGNAAYFKGGWAIPFNASHTSPDAFKDERDQVLGNIPMMTDKLVLEYGFSNEYESQFVEIPYAGGKTSMIVVLPRRYKSLLAVLKQMSGLPLTKILPEMSAEEIDLYLPKFEVSTNLMLNEIIAQLGMQHLLTEHSANFPGISSDVYVSKVVHHVSITNNEEGTEAAAATAAHVSYKTSSVTFQANRPFAYFINDIPTRTILFAGTYVAPN